MTVGLAWDDGLIRDVHDKVAPYMGPMLVIDDIYNRDKGIRSGGGPFPDALSYGS